MSVITQNESRELKSLRKALNDYDKQVEIEALEIMTFTSCEKERRELVNWMLQTNFDVWVEIELRYEHTKELSVVEIQHRHKQILTTALNVMDKPFKISCIRVLMSCLFSSV